MAPGLSNQRSFLTDAQRLLSKQQNTGGVGLVWWGDGTKEHGKCLGRLYASFRTVTDGSSPLWPMGSCVLSQAGMVTLRRVGGNGVIGLHYFVTVSEQRP